MGVSTTDKVFAIVRTLIDEVRLILADGAVWSFAGRWLGFWPCVRKKIQNRMAQPSCVTRWIVSDKPLVVFTLQSRTDWLLCCFNLRQSGSRQSLRP
jgi:hypothetical protein